MEKSIELKTVQVEDEKVDTLRNLNFYLLAMLIIDYVVTYMGIHYYQFIREANELFVWLFNLPFAQGFILRLIAALAVTALYQYIYMEGHKHYTKIITFALLVNVVVMVLHIRWLLVLMYI